MPSASSAPTLPFLERLLDGEKVEWKTLGEICEKVCSGGTPLTSHSKYYEGNIPWLRTQDIDWQEIHDTEIKITEEAIANSSAKLIPENCVIVAMYGATAAKACINKIPLTTNQACCNLQIDEKQAHYKYAYYWICNEYERLRAQGEGSQSNLNAKKIKSYPIPIPPLRVQSRIVEILDKFTQLEAELEDELAKELEARNKQYDFYRNRLLSGPLPHSPNIPHQWEQVPLGSIGEVRMCKRILKQDTTETGEIPFYKIGTFGKSADAFISRTLFEEYKQKYAYPRIGDILISASGTIGRAIEFDGQDAYFQDSNIVWLEHDDSKVLNRFLYYCYQIADWKVSKGGTISRLYNDNIKKTLIPLPPLSEQRRIVDILDRFDTLTNSISEGLPREIALRRKQYEYYRDALLRFPQPAPTA